jgi:hypothetical protein
MCIDGSLINIHFLSNASSLLRYTAGHDIKSLLINLASFLLIILPAEMYYYPEYKNEEYMVVGASFLLAFLAPPYGFLRPHPYSDLPGNKPFAPRMEFSETAIKQS